MLLKLVRQTKVDSEGQSTVQVVGRPGLQVFYFEPRRSGEGVLLLHYDRVWEKPAPDEEQFQVHVLVE